MQLFWHGLSCIRIEAKTSDVEATLITDPYDNETGLRFPRTLEADVMLLSHQNQKQFNLEAVAGSPFVISNPGEYEVKGIFAHGVQDPTIGTEEKRPLVYRINAEGISLAFLGKINRQLTDMEVEELGDVDILLIPVGGGSVFTPDAAVAAISVIEPRMVVPLYYDTPGVKESLTSVDQFCKRFGAGKRQDAPKLKLSKKDLPVDDVVVTVLERA